PIVLLPVFWMHTFFRLFTSANQSLGYHPFFRSYGVILPSSLTRVLSLTLVFSTRLPVSVCGTGMSSLARSFSWQCDYHTFATFNSLRSEEHTSELQSRFDLVCRLLLEKKNSA